MPLDFLFDRGRQHGSQSEDVLVGSGGLSQQWEEGEQRWEVMRVGWCEGLGCAVWGSRSVTVLQPLLP